MAINVAGQTRTGNDTPVDAGNLKVGRIVLDATAITAADSLLVECGFTPKYIAFENVTDRIRVEWYEGMAANTCIKTAAAGTRTLETTNGGITICDSSGVANTSGRCFSVLQNATLAVIAASKVLTFRAQG